MAYDKPTSSGLPFRFTDSGYVGPGPTSVPFEFGADVSTSDLRAAINVLGYDYLKECPTYTIATGHGLQIIQLPCIYGGIRDVGGSIHGNPIHADLGASINPIFGQAELGAYIKSTTQAYKNLGAFIRPTIQASTDLGAAIRRIDQDDKDLGSDIHGWATKDLDAFIGAHPPADLQGILNVIEVGDLPASIDGILFKGQKDLGAEVYKIFQRGPKDLGAVLDGYAPKDLGALINILGFKDLGAAIKSWVREAEKDLGGIISVQETGELSGIIHGWDYRDLGAFLVGGFGPGDLQAVINAIPPKDLGAYIAGFKGIQIPFDLQGIVSGWGAADLNAIIASIEAADLGAYIFATGKILDLGATIIPKTIRMKKALQISLLEHRDLAALINFQCFASNFKDLNAYLTPLYKADLRADVWGFRPGTAINMAAYINAETYTVQDKFIVNIFAGDNNPYTWVNVSFGVLDKYIVTNDLPLIFTPAKNLGATITGIPTSKDLGASLTAIIQANYTELPHNIRPKSHEVVIEFDEKWREQFRTFVEIMFRKDGGDNFHYFYVSGSDGVYRIDRNRHWTIWADSYQNVQDEMVERRNVRSKYIFNMSNYANVDEAVRDLIDRVSTYRRTNLSASINAIQVPQIDLGASIEAKVIVSWVKHLKASITGI